MLTQTELDERIILAIREDRSEQVRKLIIDKGINVQVVDQNNQTLLSFAIEKHWNQHYYYDTDPRLNIIRLLIANGARVEQEETAINVKEGFKNSIKQKKCDNLVNELLRSFNECNSVEYEKIKDSYVERSFEKPNGEEVKIRDLKRTSSTDDKVAIIADKLGMEKTKALLHLAE